MRIATFNVNGIRACDRRGFREWLATRRLDVIALQEVRCPTAQLPASVFGDYTVAYEPGVLAGRNGVAICTRTPPAAIRSWGTTTVIISPGQSPRPIETPVTHGAPLPQELHGFVDEGRYIEVDLADAPITVACLYLPKGGTPYTDEASLARYERKMTFVKGFARHLGHERRATLAAGRHFVVMGDWNIAHTRHDLKNWRANQKNEGFLPEEREWVSSLTEDRTLVDVVRSLHPDTDGPYSWWSWRGQAFANDVGWRIDYQLATPGLASLATDAGTDRDASYDSRLSDHAPVVVDYNLSSLTAPTSPAHE